MRLPITIFILDLDLENTRKLAIRRTVRKRIRINAYPTVLQASSVILGDNLA